MYGVVDERVDEAGKCVKAWEIVFGYRSPGPGANWEGHTAHKRNNKNRFEFNAEIYDLVPLTMIELQQNNFCILTIHCTRGPVRLSLI